MPRADPVDRDDHLPYTGETWRAYASEQHRDELSNPVVLESRPSAQAELARRIAAHELVLAGGPWVPPRPLHKGPPQRGDRR